MYLHHILLLCLDLNKRRSSIIRRNKPPHSPTKRVSIQLPVDNEDIIETQASFSISNTSFQDSSGADNDEFMNIETGDYLDFVEDIDDAEPKPLLPLERMKSFCVPYLEENVQKQHSLELEVKRTYYSYFVDLFFTT